MCEITHSGWNELKGNSLELGLNEQNRWATETVAEWELTQLKYMQILK